jgi:integrase
VSADTHVALQSVDNLKKGRTKAHEYRKIKSVDVEVVKKTLPFLPPIVADMVRVQLLCGMRPQDVCNMRLIDIDRTGDVWRYEPYTHKTEHEDKDRLVAIGPKAQVILAAYLLEKEETPEAFLFSPKDTVLLKKVERRRKRKSFNKTGQVQP